MWCLSVKYHFVSGLYIQTSLAVNCLPATSDCYYQTYAQKWWSGKLKKKKKKIFFFFLYFHIWEVLSHSQECGSRAAFLGGSRMIREGSHVCSCISKFVLIQHILSTQVSDTGPMVLWLVFMCTLLVNYNQINHPHFALMIWSPSELTSKRWIIPQQFNARAYIFLNSNTPHLYSQW